jgi:hypothetical protein
LGRKVGTLQRDNGCVIPPDDLNIMDILQKVASRVRLAATDWASFRQLQCALLALELVATIVIIQKIKCTVAAELTLPE